MARSLGTPSDGDPPADVAQGTRRSGFMRQSARSERSKEIAAQLGVTESTVKAHLASIYDQLDVDSRASAVAVALSRGLLPAREQGPAYAQWRPARRS